jgi:hypothetical protein
VTDLVCMRCGAALESKPAEAGEGQLRCSACDTVHAYAAAPTTRDLQPLSLGEPILGQWAGHWWRAELVEQTQASPERWRVRFVGWSDAFIQELERDHIHDLGGGAPLRQWKWVLAAVGVALLGAAAVLLANKGKLVSNGAAVVDVDTALRIGQAVEVEREGAWVAAEVVAVHDDGRVLVRYLDRGPMGDETVGRDRLRLP